MLATAQRVTDKDKDGKIEVKTFANVTLEVTPRIAEKIAVAQSMGTLSLSLRSIADNSAELERAVAAGDVKIPVNANPAQEKQMLLAVANQPIDTNTTFTTGGDVSALLIVSVFEPVLPAASRAVTVMTLMPVASATLATLHKAVPLAVPLLPRSLLHVTCVTLTSSEAVPAMPMAETTMPVP